MFFSTDGGSNRRQQRIITAMAYAALALSLATFLDLGPALAAKRKTLKLATLAPEGSTWYNLLREAGDSIERWSNKSLRVRIYPGGVAGDEPDFVRKMRVGQLQGAAVTSVGIGNIEPELLVLQAPGAIRDWDELEAVRLSLSETFEELLRRRGYEVLVWAYVGFGRVFSDREIRTPSDLHDRRCWCWTQDGAHREFLNAAGVTPVMLGVPEVLPGLQTGLIDTYATPPLVSLSLQWFTRSKYMLDHPVHVTIGAVVVTSSFFARLDGREREVLRRVRAEYGPRLRDVVKTDNEKAITALQNAGLKIVIPSAAERKSWQTVADRAAVAAAGKVYSKALHKRLTQVVVDHRQNAVRSR